MNAKTIEMAKLQKAHMQELQDWISLKQQHKVNGINISECLLYNLIQHLNQLVYNESLDSDTTEVQSDD